MKGGPAQGFPLFDVVEGHEVVTHGTVARLATIAILRSRLVVSLLHDTVIPALHPAARGAARVLARKLERGDLFDERLLADLGAMGDRLEAIVAAGTHLEWEAIDGHVRGGHEMLRQDPGIAELAIAQEEVQKLHDALMATVSAARAIKDAERLLLS